MNKKSYLEGIQKSIDNAKELINDANILFAYERYPRSYTLYQLSIEELGKASMIFNYIVFSDYNDLEEQKKFKRKFLNHKEKTSTSSLIDVLLALVIKDKDLKKKIIQQHTKHQQGINEINELKNISLYTNLKGEKFLNPSEVISKDLVSEIKFISEYRYSIASKFYFLCLENFESIEKIAENFDEEKFMKNPPDDIIELAKMKIDIEGKIK